jgi:hypothetical protein
MKINPVSVNRYLCAAVLFCSLLACSKNEVPVENNRPAENDFHEYIILRGQHYATGNNFGMLQKRSIHFVARFDSSCIYTLAKAENAGDINKLYGFSDCGSGHHENSARFGWVWNGKAIDLYAYCYSEGQRSSKLLGAVGIAQEVELSLAAEPGKYVFVVNGNTATMKRSCSDDKTAAYQLFPYFGGDEVAPHDVRIFIKDL